VVQRVLAAGDWVAWVDARRTLAPQPWAGLGSRLVMIRPREAARSAWSADLLLRSGVFALVVLDGAPLLSRVTGVRLAQLARERNAALVVVADGTQPSRMGGGAIRLRLTPSIPPSITAPGPDPANPPRRRPHGQSGGWPVATAASGPPPGFSVTVEKGGVLRSVEVSCAVVVARRVCADPEIPDRRGVARGTRHPWTPHSHTADGAHTPHPITWGGLGASVADVRSADTAAPAPAGGDPTRPPLSGPSARGARDLDRRTREWSSAKGRRRAAESGYGRRTRREIAREQTGASINTQSGQSQGANGTSRVGRDGGSQRRGGAAVGGGGAHATGAFAALGRVPAGVG
jgi:uncharacterized membrane protein YgcG